FLLRDILHRPTCAGRPASQLEPKSRLPKEPMNKVGVCSWFVVPREPPQLVRKNKSLRGMFHKRCSANKFLGVRTTEQQIVLSDKVGRRRNIVRRQWLTLLRTETQGCNGADL